MARYLRPIVLVASLLVCGGCATEKRVSEERTGPPQQTSKRLVVDLNGTWEIAQGSMDSVPEVFEHNVPVPGLVDMAEPAFEEVGKKSERRQAFWYRRKFTLDAAIGDIALLKIGIVHSILPPCKGMANAIDNLSIIRTVETIKTGSSTTR